MTSVYRVFWQSLNWHVEQVGDDNPEFRQDKKDKLIPPEVPIEELLSPCHFLVEHLKRLDKVLDGFGVLLICRFAEW